MLHVILNLSNVKSQIAFNITMHQNMGRDSKTHEQRCKIWKDK